MIEQVKQQVLPILKEAGVLRSSVFGSVARGEARPDSDVDLLVELPPRTSLLGLAGLQIKLQDTLGRKVDVITYDSIYPPLKPYIEKDKIDIL